MNSGLACCVPIGLGLLINGMIADASVEAPIPATPTPQVVERVIPVIETVETAAKETPQPQFVSTTVLGGGCAGGSCSIPVQAQAPQQYRSGVFRGGRRFAILPRNRRR